jgi:hypothetical protein
MLAGWKVYKSSPCIADTMDAVQHDGTTNIWYRRELKDEIQDLV